MARISPTGTCFCGCSGSTTHWYAQGHDARHASAIATMIADGGDRAALLAELPSDALRAQAERIALNRGGVGA